MNAVRSAKPVLDDGTCVSEELIGRLHRATEDSVLDIVAAFRANERASLAMYCYRKSHLRGIGLAIAATCDLKSLVQEWGSILGRSIFAQSRERSEESAARMGMRPRPQITLARWAGGKYPAPIDIDEEPQSTCLAQTGECTKIFEAL
jgi:hypothetical protein